MGAELEALVRDEEERDDAPLVNCEADEADVDVIAVTVEGTDKPIAKEVLRLLVFWYAETDGLLTPDPVMDCCPGFIGPMG